MKLISIARNLRWRDKLIALFVLALIPGIGCVLLRPPIVEVALSRLNDSADYDHLAQKILEGKFTSPSGAPTAFRPPAYPAFLAIVYLIFGKQNLLAVALIQAALGALNCLLIVRLSEKITGSKNASWIAGLIAALYPAFILQSSQILTETLGRFLWLLCLAILIESCCRQNRKGLILAGIVFALAILNKSVLLIAAPILTLWIVYKINGTFWNRVQSALICFLLPIAVIVGGWTYRNYRISGKVIAVSTNFPVTFAHGVTRHNYYAMKWYGSERLMAVPEDYLELTQMRFYRGVLEEIEVGEYYSGRAKEFIRNNKGFFLRMSLRKGLHFWSPFISNAPMERFLAFISMAPVLILGWAGIVCSLRDNKTSRDYALFILAIAFLTSAPYILSQSDIRYRVGIIDPLWMIYSGLALVFLFQKVRIPHPGESSDPAPGGAHDA